MDQSKATAYLWATAHYLIKHKGYYRVEFHMANTGSIISLDTGQQVIHLMKRIGNELKYIRLALVDFVWSSVVERSVKECAATMELFRKQLKADRMEGLCLYFFHSSPIQDVRNRLDQFGKVRIGTTTYLHSVYVDLETESLPKIDHSAFYISNDELSFILSGEVRQSGEYIHDLEQMEDKKEPKRKHRFSLSIPYPVTSLLIAVNLILFLILSFSGGSTNPETLIRFGAKYDPAITNGEWWRLFTSIFLHIGFVHLTFNTLALYYLGSVVERIYGSVRFLTIYLLAGLSGSLASFLYNEALSAGASGAIYGCFGALIYFGLKRRAQFFQSFGKELYTILLLNLAISFIVPGIDLFAHIGGLIGGFLASVLVNITNLHRGI